MVCQKSNFYLVDIDFQIVNDLFTQCFRAIPIFDFDK
jgi:hypothetical protein